MKIKSISCTQFAGIRDRSISFSDGINVICGKNESGKSTIAELLLHTLFQDVKLDRRTDKAFINRYYPAAKKGSDVAGDFIDGKVSFETADGCYTLTKEWSNEPRCLLSTSNGILRDRKKIDDILSKALLYGEGVYSDMLLSTQSNSGIALQRLLDPQIKAGSKQELTDILTQAFAESDGISIDAIEQAIESKIKEIGGSHWDSEKNAPVRRTGRYSTGLGEILKAYYALQDANEVLSKIISMENEADTCAREYDKLRNDTETAEALQHSFNEFSGRLSIQRERKETVKRLTAELDRYSAVLNEWPVLCDNTAKAEVLSKQLEQRRIIDLYFSADALNKELETLRSAAENTICPTDEDISALKKALTAISKAENQLCGMNLSAQLKKLGNNEISVVSLRTGNKLDINCDNIAITEAVKIIIPDVMEMILTPADIDCDSVREALNSNLGIADSILGKYKADSIEALEKLAAEHISLTQKAALTEERLRSLLNGTALETLRDEKDAIKENIRSSTEITADIAALCRQSDISSYIAGNKAIIERYTEEYDSIEALQQKAAGLQAQIKKTSSCIDKTDDIPQEFLNISDPLEYSKQLAEKVKLCRETLDEALSEKTVAVSRLETFKETLNTDPREAIETAQRKYDNQKELLSHWLHIRKVFNEQKKALSGNPMKDISERFSHYLNIITGGGISSEFPEQDRLEMNIYSKDCLMDFTKLSEGTKDTVLLAFRLAAMDHLFPDGGIALFDDPFTNMDSERTKQACDLLKEFSKRHQIIFLTCNEEYPDMLGGNLISV